MEIKAETAAETHSSGIWNCAQLQQCIKAIALSDLI